MRSILTLEGASAPRKKKQRNPPPPLGTCKSVHNPRTKKTLQLCYVGRTWKGKTVPTGWRLMSQQDLAELKRR